ncbi:MAG: efflux RND transporter permease subunit [Gammaproteobacteria bacterium]|nr:efflux RND transporter permease subunit [Gammaproteobacteria bacterium]
MLLSDVSVKRPVFAIVINLLLVAFGLFFLSKLTVREYPNIDPPIVSVETTYPGASASVVETRITQVIESQISGIEGIRAIESASVDGVSDITIEFNLSRPIDAASNDVRDRVSRVLDNLPEEADPPEISKAEVDASPIIWLVLSSASLDRMGLSDYADRYLLDRFSAIDGVSNVRVSGDRRYAMRIWLDRKAMAARNVTVDDIEGALISENVELPAGRLESEEREFTLRTAREYRTADDFRQLVIARGRDGYLVRLAEVARIEEGAEDLRSEYRADGAPTVGISIVKQSQANTLEVAQAVKREVHNIAPTLPEDMVLQVNSDSSLFIERSLEEVEVTLLISAVLVIFVIYLFLGSLRATLAPAFTVPISLIASFILLYAFGFSINILTLLALVLAIGIVVDDTIVVVENIHRRIEAGEAPLLAAFRGAREVGFAVVATTLVLAAVFVPMAFLEGTVGRLFREFALAMAAAIICSSLVALSLGPVLCAMFLTRRERHNPLVNVASRGIAATMRGYRVVLERVLRHPLPTCAAALAVLAGTVLLFIQLPGEFAPAEDQGQIYAMMSAPEGASFEYSSRQLKKIEAAFMQRLGEGEIQRVIARIPGYGGGSDAVNSGVVQVSLTPWEERERSAETIAGEIGRELAATVPGAQVAVVQRSSFGSSSTGTELELVLGGSTYEELAQWRDRLVERAEENAKIVSLDSDYDETKPQIDIDIARDRAAELGVSVETIGRTLETMLGSRSVTTFVNRGEEYDVILQAADADRRSPTDLANIHVRSQRSGELIPLSNLVTTRETAGAASLNRYDRLRAITISADLAEGYALGDAMGYFQRIVDEELPGSARISYTGDARELQESSQSLYLTFALGLLVVYLILAAQFESFVHPFVIMTTVPLAIFGALAGLSLSGGTLNIYSQIGIIMLIGLAAKNGILIVEFANQRRDAGLKFTDALIDASITRFRPIMMTSLSTAMGVLPLMLATGAGAESRIAIGVTVFSGIIFATVMTLFVVPAFYALMCRKTTSPGAVGDELARLQRSEVHANY